MLYYYTTALMVPTRKVSWKKIKKSIEQSIVLYKGWLQFFQPSDQRSRDSRRTVLSLVIQLALSSVADYRGKPRSFSQWQRVRGGENRRWFRWFLVTAGIDLTFRGSREIHEQARETRGNVLAPTALHKIYLALVQRVVGRSFFWRTFRDATPSAS